MAQTQRPRLQGKLVLAFVLVILIPTIAISAYNQVRARSVLIEQNSNERMRLAIARADSAKRLIAQGSTDLLVAVQSPSIRRYVDEEGDRIAGVGRYFESLLRYSAGRYDAACLLSSDGVEQICVRLSGGRTHVVPAAELGNRRDEPYFNNAMQRAGIVGDGPVEVSSALPTASRPALVRYATFFTDDRGATAGVIVLESPAQSLFDLLIDTDPNVNTTVVDRDGTLLLRTTEHHGSRPAATHLSELQPVDSMTILRQSSGVIVQSAEVPDCIQIFTRVRPLGQSSLQWTVIYEQPLQGILAEVETTQTVSLLITGTALLLALVVAQLLARSIVRPISALAAAAERVGAGDLHTPIPVSGNDEIAALGSTLRHTVTRLRESLQLAEGRMHEAETLRTAAGALSSTLAHEQVLDIILSELQKVVPYNSASVQIVQGDSVEIIGTYGNERPESIVGRRFALDATSSPNGEVIRTRAPLILDDGPARYPLFKAEPFRDDPIRSWLGVPLLFADRVIGMITLDKHEPGFYTAAHARLATDFATQAASAMENARLYEAAQQEVQERRRAELALSRLAAIIETTTDIVSMSHLDGTILFINRAGRRALGIAPEVDVQTINASSFYGPEAAARLRQETLPRALREGTWSGETILLTTEGQSFPASQVVITHYAPDGTPEFISTIIRDISERLRAEEELRQAQKMEALGRLAGGLAHDFNNLLTVILGEADMVLGDMDRANPDRESIEQIRQSGSRAAALTRQLLAFSRRQMLQPEQVNLNEVIHNMEQMLRRLIGEDITLTIALAQELPTVRADPSQVEQVVMNLAINARDAMPDGGHLLIETSTARLDGEYARQHADVQPGLHALVAVTDTGLGMDEATRSHVFEPFFTTKPRGKGTGLGLATVHGIVRQSGGHIWFYSEPEHGSTFKIFLPASAEPAPESPAEPPQPVVERAAAETLLLVEDDEHVRSLARTLLLRAGFSVLEASDGVAALELVHKEPGSIDILLTDMIMPGGLNGVQLARAVRNLRPAICVVYMSGYTDNALVERSLAEDGARFIQKPFTADILVETILASLAQGRAGRV